MVSPAPISRRTPDDYGSTAAHLDGDTFIVDDLFEPVLSPIREDTRVRPPSFRQSDDRSDAVAGLTEYAVRAGVRSAGASVGHDQLRDFARVGLLRPEGGRWPADSVQRVLRILDAGETVRSLERRVILLRNEPLFWDIPAEKLRAALIAVAQRIDAQKLRRVDRSVAYCLGQQSRPLVRREGLAPRSQWKMPPKREWAKILTDPRIDDARFAERCGVQYSYAGAVLPAYVRGSDFDLSKKPAIPFEEQIALLTVRDLAIFHERRAAAEARASAAVLTDDEDRCSIAPTASVPRDYWEGLIHRAGIALRAALPKYAKYYAADGFDCLRAAILPVRARVHAETMEFLRENPHLEREGMQGTVTAL
jgi:hypothetical protein